MRCGELRNENESPVADTGYGRPDRDRRGAAALALRCCGHTADGRTESGGGGLWKCIDTKTICRFCCIGLLT